MGCGPRALETCARNAGLWSDECWLTDNLQFVVPEKKLPEVIEHKIMQVKRFAKHPASNLSLFASTTVVQHAVASRLRISVRDLGILLQWAKYTVEPLGEDAENMTRKQMAQKLKKLHDKAKLIAFVPNIYRCMDEQLKVYQDLIGQLPLAQFCAVFGDVEGHTRAMLCMHTQASSSDTSKSLDLRRHDFCLLASPVAWGCKCVVSGTADSCGCALRDRSGYARQDCHAIATWPLSEAQLARKLNCMAMSVTFPASLPMGRTGIVALRVCMFPLAATSRVATIVHVGM